MAKQVVGDEGSSAPIRADASPLTDARAGELVYRELVARLVSKEIPPGSRISIDGMSRRLGVSQTPVREALSQLESEGVVVRNHLAGFRAQPLLNAQQFEHLFEIRMLLEPRAAELAATRHTSEQLRRLRVALDRRQRQADSDAVSSQKEFQRDGYLCLHDLIADASGNPLISDAIAKVHVHVHLFRVHHDAGISAEAIVEHEAIVDAIADGSSKDAAREMKAHLRGSRRRLGSIL